MLIQRDVVPAPSLDHESSWVVEAQGL